MKPRTNIIRLYCISCEHLFEKERYVNSSNAVSCPKCKSASSVVTSNHPFYKGYKVMKYLTETERLDDGLCPKCETELVASDLNCVWNYFNPLAKHNGGHSDDKHAVCTQCGWEDDIY